LAARRRDREIPLLARMLGSDAGDTIECSLFVDVARQIAERNEKNNNTVVQIPGLLGEGERQGNW
jgi:hypothetical protein